MPTPHELFADVIGKVAAGRPVALCVVVRTRGSAPQDAGAMMVVDAGTRTVGTLGGGCVEAEVSKQARAMLAAGRSGRLTFTLDHDYGWDDGLICGGAMDVAVETIARPEQLATFREALAAMEANEEAAVVIRIDTEDGPQAYRVVTESRPTLLIAGAGHVGQATAALASQVGFRVVVMDDRADCCNAERFPTADVRIVADIESTLRAYPLDASCYVVIVTRGHQHDEQALAAVLGRPARYVGMIGSRRKSKLIFDDLIEAGADPKALEAVHTPVGICIHAVTVPEIAVSIVAELIAVRRRDRSRQVTGPFPLDEAS